jgi:hypothetical protein
MDPSSTISPDSLVPVSTAALVSDSWPAPVYSVAPTPPPPLTARRASARGRARRSTSTRTSRSLPASRVRPSRRTIGACRATSLVQLQARAVRIVRAHVLQRSRTQLKDLLRDSTVVPLTNSVRLRERTGFSQISAAISMNSATRIASIPQVLGLIQMLTASAAAHAVACAAIIKITASITAPGQFASSSARHAFRGIAVRRRMCVSLLNQ